MTKTKIETAKTRHGKTVAILIRWAAKGNPYNTAALAEAIRDRDSHTSFRFVLAVDSRGRVTGAGHAYSHPVLFERG